MDYIFLVSNGSTELYKNTLSKFTNVLPDVFTKSNAAFEIGVSEIIFDSRFSSPVIPTRLLCPAIMCSRIKPLDISEKKIQGNQL